MSIRNVTASLPAELEYSVKKATKEENEIPKPKHLKNIQMMLEDGYGNIPAVLRLLDHRMHKRYWPITYKSLLVLHWFCHVDSVSDKWYRALMLNLSMFHLDYAQDESSAMAYDNTRQMKAFGLYLEQKVSLYHALHFDATSSKAHIVEAFKILPYREEMIERLELLSKAISAALKCDFSGFAYYEPLPCNALEAIMEDLRNLCAATNALVASMLKQFFGLPKQDAQRCLTAYRAFADLMTQVQNWFQALRTTCRAFRVEAPALTTAPLSLASTLKAYIESPDFEEERAKYLESNPSQDGDIAPKQRSAKSSPPTSASKSRTAASTTSPSKSTAVVAPAAAPAKKDNLIDFFDSIEPTPSAQPQVQQSQQVQPSQGQQQVYSQQSNDFFGQSAQGGWQQQQQPMQQQVMQQQGGFFGAASSQYMTASNSQQGFPTFNAQNNYAVAPLQPSYTGQTNASFAQYGQTGNNNYFANGASSFSAQPTGNGMPQQQQPAFSAHSFWQAEAQNVSTHTTGSYGVQQQRPQYQQNVNPFAELGNSAAPAYNQQAYQQPPQQQQQQQAYMQQQGNPFYFKA